MSSANELHYNHEGFPYYEILDELTDWAYQNQANPLETYLRYRRLRRDARLTPCPDYASTSITSGGHARRPGLDSYTVINANADTARRIVAEMSAQGSLDARGTILPVDLGHLPVWKQSDYMHFWSLVISGPDLGIKRRNQTASKYQKNLDKKIDKKRVDIAKMNDPAEPATARAPEYFKFADAFVSALSENHSDSNPVRSVIGLVDPETSLGCQTEKLLAKILTIPVKRLSPVRKINSYNQAIEDHKLVEDMDEIIKFGGTIVEISRGELLIAQGI